MPVSMAYCKTCLEANAHPWGCLVGQASCIGPTFESYAPWFIQMIDDTCKHLGKTREAFLADVKKADDDYQAYCEEQMARDGDNSP
jgi:hypothetical protein